MTKEIQVGNLFIGGKQPISVQSMTNTDTLDVEGSIAQISLLENAGADLVRVTVQDKAAATAFGKIVARTHIPLIADIHFNAETALYAIENGAAKIRLNPGNTPLQLLKDITSLANEKNVAIRVGVNRGSVRGGEVTPELLVDLCLDTVKKMEDIGFYNMVVAVKSSDVSETVKAYRLLSEKCDYPLHIGLTEAGVGENAKIQTALAVGALLADGIGDTLRVSIAGDPVQEVIAARRMLNYMGLRHDMPKVIACPTCGRTDIQVEKLALKIENAVEKLHKPIKIAVMGCIVNGLGEGRDADIGVAGGKEQSVIFKGGKKLAVIDNEDIEKELLKYIGEML